MLCDKPVVIRLITADHGSQSREIDGRDGISRRFGPVMVLLHAEENRRIFARGIEIPSSFLIEEQLVLQFVFTALAQKLHLNASICTEVEYCLSGLQFGCPNKPVYIAAEFVNIDEA